MSDTEMVIAVIGIVSAIRKVVPRIEGVLVLFVAMLVALGVAFAFDTDDSPKALLKHVVMLGVLAFGSTHLVDRVAKGTSKAIAKVQA